MKIYSVRNLAQLLGLSRDALKTVTTSIDSMYSPYIDTSRAKPRTIDRPNRELRELQRRVYDLLLRDHAYSLFAWGGIPKRSLKEAVAVHRSRPLIVQVDVKNFYPSISDRAVFNVWRRLGHGPKVASVLTRITTYKRHLPQGAPTSLALANIFMEPVDRQVFATLHLSFDDIRYTRYVDDLIFSGRVDAAAVLAVVARHLRAVGLHAHRAREKRRILPSHSRQEILGMVVNREVSLSRRRKRLTRAIVHTANKFGGDINSVKGHIQHLRTFHASLADELEDSLRLAAVLFDGRGSAAAG